MIPFGWNCSCTGKGKTINKPIKIVCIVKKVEDFFFSNFVAFSEHMNFKMLLCSLFVSFWDSSITYLKKAWHWTSQVCLLVPRWHPWWFHLFATNNHHFTALRMDAKLLQQAATSIILARHKFANLFLCKEY